MFKINTKTIVKILNDHIIGQENAKKIISIALVNRLRRLKLKKKYRKEIFPKNILLTGPTGVGKTEISRRIAKILDSPFIRVEATKFTELGYVGKDVDTIIKDLSEISFNILKNKIIKRKYSSLKKKIEQEIVDLLIISIFNNDESKLCDNEIRKKIYENLKNKIYEEKEIELKIKQTKKVGVEIITASEIEETFNKIQSIFKGSDNKNKVYKIKVKDARKILLEEELNKSINIEEIKNRSIKLIEEQGIVFIDEIDKICVSKNKYISNDISNEGVQKDLLSLVEGTYIKTKYGIINTNYILFIASGAFSDSSPDDLISEFKGRFPIKIKLDSLDKKDFIKILNNPNFSLIEQYKLLLSTEKIKINFTQSAIEYISEIAHNKNIEKENLGARRLYEIIEKILEEISFNSYKYINKEILIDKKYIELYIKKDINFDINKYIL